MITIQYQKQRKFADTVIGELDPLLLEDGSIKDRTTRGNRGLFTISLVSRIDDK